MQQSAVISFFFLVFLPIILLLRKYCLFTGLGEITHFLLAEQQHAILNHTLG